MPAICCEETWHWDRVGRVPLGFPWCFVEVNEYYIKGFGLDPSKVPWLQKNNWTFTAGMGWKEWRIRKQNQFVLGLMAWDDTADWRIMKRTKLSFWRKLLEISLLLFNVNRVNRSCLICSDSINDWMTLLVLQFPTGNYYIDPQFQIYREVKDEG